MNDSMRRRPLRSRISVRIGWRPGGSSRRVLIDEVGVERQRERAWNGRGGQRQQVRLTVLALRLQGGALLDAEAVLLVDHRQGQAAEDDRVADDRVRADHHLHLAGADGGVDGALARGGEAPREELGANPQRLEEWRNRR